MAQGLLLTRKVGQGFTILLNHEDIKINIESLTDTYVKIRIDAPKSLKIWRDEIVQNLKVS